MSELRKGYAAGFAAYLLWGLFPLYWRELRSAGAVEILAHRIVWSVLVLALILAVSSGFRWVTGLGRRRTLLLALASVLITINWGGYIYGVNSGHVVETALGYFIGPLVTVALAVGILRERLRRYQWIAVLIGTLAVVVLTVDYGRPPWIALTLATSFGLYGLVKKRAGVDGVKSLAVETAFLLAPASAYLVFLDVSGRGTFTTLGDGHTALLMGAGLVTALPLILFGAAAIRVPLTAVGLLQYLAPSLQFLLGVFVFGEAMPASRWAGFGLVWIALSVFTVDAVRAMRRTEAPAPAGAAAVA